VSRSESDTATAHRQNLTQERRRLRRVHDARNPPEEIPYRGHTIRAENPHHPDHDAYELVDADDDTLLALERSDFNNSDDWVRAFDLAIQQSPEAARDWLRNDLFWGWSQ
jgi:hypothetical protein